VISVQVVEDHLTEKCLTIILLKKRMNAQDWPRLYKAGVLPYVKTDFKLWTWEGDQSDDIINESTDHGTREMTSGQHFGQVIIVQNSVICDIC
jgi:hypothetical protein